MAVKPGKRVTTFLLICHALGVDNSSNKYCQWAVNTVEVVSSCPLTEEERDKASDSKNCTQVAQKQNCSDPTEFKYHCVINELQNKLLEVCAPSWYILGYCTQFNVQGGIIQDDYSAECSKFEPPCKMRYISTDAYLYRACYDLIKKSPVSDVISSTSSSVNNMLSTNNITTVDIGKTETSPTDAIYIFGITVAVSAVVLLVVAVVYCRRNCTTRLAGNQDNHKERATMLRELEHDLYVEAIGQGLSTRDEEQAMLNSNAALHDVEDEEQAMLNSNAAMHDVEDGKFNVDAESLISTDSYTDLSAQIRGKLLLEMALEGQEGDASGKNEHKALEYLESFKKFDNYFVETILFIRVKELLQTEHIAIIAGSPGCGKTNTAVHLMLDKSYETWIKHTIHSWKDLSFLRSDKATLVLIDNIFDGYIYSQELERWWDAFYSIFNDIIRKSEGKVKFLITAKKNVIEKACAYMRKPSPVLKPSCIVYTGEIELSDREKDKIFEMQMKYAEEVKGIKPSLENLTEDSEFRKEIKRSKGPLGFPLCAHLYACNENYRPMGSHFFSNPINYLKSQIMYEISSDSSQRTKTLFLLLCLVELKNCSTSANEYVDFVEAECEQFMQNFLKDDLVELQPLNFSKLEDVAIHYTGTLLSGTQKSKMYRFKHKTIFNAVGDYFLEKHFECAVKVFPLDVFESCEFSMCTKNQSDALISRFISEVKKGNVSKVFACKALNCETYAERFCRYLSKQTKSSLTEFLATTDLPSGFPLPPTFWISKHKLSSLTTLLFKVMEEKNIDIKLHIYFSLLGELCADDENLLKISKEQIYENMKNAKNIVLNYKLPDGYSILHFVVQSNRSDFQCVNIVKRLMKDTIERKPGIKINKENDYGESPISTAAKQFEYSRILTCLAIIEDKEGSVHETDHKGFSPIHHAVSTLPTKDYSNTLELEVMVRLAIFMANAVDPDLHNNEQKKAVDMCKNTPYEHVRELLYCKMTDQLEMANLIEAEISRMKIPYEINNTLYITNPRNIICQELMQALKKSISLLCELKF